MAGMRIGAATLLSALALAAPAAAQDCMTADPPPIDQPTHALRFGNKPTAAGSAGATQAQVAPEDEAKAGAALADLQPRRKQLVMRLNRLFWADGDEGIARFAALADEYQAQGFAVESQVRYHPPEGKEGDIAAWEAYVRSAVHELALRPSVVAFSITNEGNFPASANTSDGAYEGVVDALVRGVIVAHDELAKMGRSDVQVGFAVMWRWTPESDAKFWDDIAARATPEFHAALDYVGLQVYPGLVWPPAPRPGVPAGDEVIEALTLLRRCYMPRASLSEAVDLWVSENGYATNLGRSEQQQNESLDSTVRALHEWSGELGISDYRWFNLRDNNSDGTDLFAAVGLLRDDYSRKPAFELFRSLVADLGLNRRRPRPRVLLRVERKAIRGRLSLPAGVSREACTGSVMLRWSGGHRRVAPVATDCSFRADVATLRARRASGRFNGNDWLLPAKTARLVRR